MQSYEIKAVIEFLSNYVTPFYSNRLKREVLESLVNIAEVIEIESDDVLFSHKTDEQSII